MGPKESRLLLAEDHQDTCDLLTLVLTRENYEVAISPSVTKALELAKGQKFDVMIIDSRLSDGTGVELCCAIRQYDGLTPILFYSGLGYEKDKQEAFDAGAQDYLVKPVNTSLLIERLGKLIADSKTHSVQVNRTSRARKDSGDLQTTMRA
jgi:DNA-binding response OmpR family regulator